MTPAMMILAALDVNAIAQASALRLVDCLIEGTLIAGFAAVVLRVMRRQSSAARFAVWFSALVAIAALPLASPLIGSGAGFSGAAFSAEKVSRALVTLPASSPLYLMAAWGAIAGWSLVRVGLGLWHLHGIRKSCVPVDDSSLDARLQQTVAGALTTRPIELCTSNRVHIPTAIGLVKPAVVIPEWVMRELSPEELNQIMLHEVAHLRRWDDWTNLAQKVVKALLFFHPAVWWIERQVSLEREMACDDAVVEATASPRAYAECLAHLAEKTLIRRSVALAQAALGRIRQTSLRVAQILDVNRNANRPRSGRAWKPAVGLVGAFALVCVVGVSRAPRLIAFSDGAAGHVGGSATAVTDFGITPVSTPIPIVKARAVDKLSSGASRRGKNLLRAAAARPSASTVHTSVVNASVVHSSSGPGSAGRASIVPANLRVTSAKPRAQAVTPIAFTETIFVVVEGNDGSPDGAGIQIQMWRVMVLHPAIDPDRNRVPAKQT